MQLIRMMIVRPETSDTDLMGEVQFYSRLYFDFHLFHVSVRAHRGGTAHGNLNGNLRYEGFGSTRGRRNERPLRALKGRWGGRPPPVG